MLFTTVISSLLFYSQKTQLNVPATWIPTIPAGMTAEVEGLGNHDNSRVLNFCPVHKYITLLLFNDKSLLTLEELTLHDV